MAWHEAVAAALFMPGTSWASLQLIMNCIIDVSHLGLLLISSYKVKDRLLLRSGSLGNPFKAYPVVPQLGRIKA